MPEPIDTLAFFSHGNYLIEHPDVVDSWDVVLQAPWAGPASRLVSPSRILSSTAHSSLVLQILGQILSAIVLLPENSAHQRAALGPN